MREHVRRGPACVADVRGQMVIVHRCGLFDRQTTPRASARYPFKFVVVIVVVFLLVLVALAVPVPVLVWVPLRRWYGRRRAYSRAPFCWGVKVVVVSLVVVVVVVVIIEKVAIYVAHVDQLNIWWLRAEIEGGDFDGTYERRS